MKNAAEGRYKGSGEDEQETNYQNPHVFNPYKSWWGWQLWWDPRQRLTGGQLGVREEKAICQGSEKKPLSRGAVI